MVGVRKHYVTICFRDNTEVTYVLKPNGKVEVEFETAVGKGFHSLTMSESCEVIRCYGYSPSDVDFFKRFLKDNISLIKRWAKENA